jgi:hypothetical protein
MTMAGLSQEKSNDDRLNEYIVTFQLQKITYNGVEGFFIPFSGYKQVLLCLNDYIYYQDLVILKNERIKQLESLETLNFQLKTGLGVSISFNIGISLVAVGVGVLCYGLSR